MTILDRLQAAGQPKKITTDKPVVFVIEFVGKGHFYQYFLGKSIYSS
jgi:hypothetical protein